MTNIDKYILGGWNSMFHEATGDALLVKWHHVIYASQDFAMERWSSCDSYICYNCEFTDCLCENIDMMPDK